MTGVAALVLAAGRSSRFGKPGTNNKLVASVNGAPLVRHAALSALDSRVSRVIVAVGRDETGVRFALAGLPVEWAKNPVAGGGLATSLRAGLALLGPETVGVVVCLGDMPEVAARHIDALLDGFLASAGEYISVPTYRGRRGNPVLWPARWFGPLRGLEGDTGGRVLIERHPEAVRSVPVSDPGILVDIDTEDDLRRLNARTAPDPGG